MRAMKVYIGLIQKPEKSKQKDVVKTTMEERRKKSCRDINIYIYIINSKF